MNLSRRDALLSTLFGAGYVGLRALATGLPASFLLNPRKALRRRPGAGAAPRPRRRSTSSSTRRARATRSTPTCPAPTTIPNIVHSADPTHGAHAADARRADVPRRRRRGRRCPQSVLDRTVFWHLMTNTPVHPKEPEVLELMGATPPRRDAARRCSPRRWRPAWARSRRSRSASARRRRPRASPSTARRCPSFRRSRSRRR